MDVSDFDGDDDGMLDEVPPSPRPPSHPRPQSQAGTQDTRTDSPRAVMGRRVHATSRASQQNVVSSIVLFCLLHLYSVTLCCISRAYGVSA